MPIILTLPAKRPIEQAQYGLQASARDMEAAIESCETFREAFELYGHLFGMEQTISKLVDKASKHMTDLQREGK